LLCFSLKHPYGAPLSDFLVSRPTHKAVLTVNPPASVNSASSVAAQLRRSHSIFSALSLSLLKSVGLAVVPSLHGDNSFPSAVAFSLFGAEPDGPALVSNMLANVVKEDIRPAALPLIITDTTYHQARAVSHLLSNRVVRLYYLGEEDEGVNLTYYSVQPEINDGFHSPISFFVNSRDDSPLHMNFGYLTDSCMMAEPESEKNDMLVRFLEKRGNAAFRLARDVDLLGYMFRDVLGGALNGNDCFFSCWLRATGNEWALQVPECMKMVANIFSEYLCIM
jgi:hypothetical protein